MQADSETMAKLMRCRDPGDALQCQCQAAEKAVRDYLDEAEKLSGLATKLALSHYPSVSGSAKESHPV